MKVKVKEKEAREGEKRSKDIKEDSVSGRHSRSKREEEMTAELEKRREEEEREDERKEMRGQGRW